MTAYTPPRPAGERLPGRRAAVRRNTNVLYRIDAGRTADPGDRQRPGLAGGQQRPEPVPQLGSNIAAYGQVANVSSTVPATTPSGIFNSERWDPGQGDGQEMHWSFPVTAGIPIEVRLYFANRYTGTSQVGQRVFDVALDGATVLNHYDIVADAGDQTGTMKAFDITSPAQRPRDHRLRPRGREPADQRHRDRPYRPGSAHVVAVRHPAEALVHRITAGATSTVDTGTIAWSQVRGAFMVGNDAVLRLHRRQPVPGVVRRNHARHAEHGRPVRRPGLGQRATPARDRPTAV